MSAMDMSARRPPESRTAGHSSPGAMSRLTARSLVTAAIERAEAVVREETAALKSSRLDDLRDSTNRKSHLIVDLNASLGQLSAADIGGELHQRLESLRSMLAENMSAIKIHLEAVREVATLLSDSAFAAESDGTYSRVPWGRRHT